MAKKFLALNIGAATVALAEYEVGSNSSLKLVNYGVSQLSAPLDGGNAAAILAPALLEIVREKGIRPGKVAVAISGQMVFPRFAEIPMTGGAERFEQMVRYEIEQNIPFPIDEMVCDRQILGDTEAGDKSVLIVATKIDQLEEITSAIMSAGFIPEIVDATPLALTNTLRFWRPEEECAIILDIGAKTSSLVIAEGDRIYTRSIPVAGNVITREIATALGCSADEAEQVKCEHGYVSMGGVTEDADETIDCVSKVCRAVLTRLNAEIVRSINFYRSQQGGGAPTRIYLTGGTALLPQIDTFFADALGIEVVFLNPFDQIEIGSKVDSEAMGTDGAFIASTVGLALHQCEQARFAINLLPPSLISERMARARIPILIAAGVLLIVGLVAIMLSFGSETEVINARREAITGKVASLQEYERKVKAANESFSQTQAEADALRKLLVARAAAIQRMNAVRSSLVSGMWIEKWEAADTASSRVVIRYWKDRVVSDKTRPLSEVVLNRLKRKPIVIADSVKIAEMSMVGSGDSPVGQFVVELKFN